MNQGTSDGIRCLHWSRFLKLLWEDFLGLDALFGETESMR